MAIIVGTGDPNNLQGGAPSLQGSTPALQQTSNPQSSPAPATVAAPRATQTGVQDFSKRYGLFNGAVYDKVTNSSFSSDAEFKKVTGYSSNGQKFDTSYIPPSAIPPIDNKPITSSDLERSTTLPEVSNFISATSGATLSQKVSAVASMTLDSTKQILDQLYKQKEDQAAADKAATQANIDSERAGIVKLSTSTQLQDTLTKLNQQYDIDNKISQYTKIQNDIVAAQEALDMGIIYEGDRPARMSFIQGAQASLMKQGLAKIGALQGTASVLKGDIDLAKSYIDQTLGAIKDDQQNQWNALTTLLNLDNQKLVTLSSDEKDAVNSRLKLITDELDQQEKNKDDILNLMTQYPSAFLSGGVTLTDTKQQALQKMLPKMASDERAKFEASLASSGTKANDQKAKQEMLGLKAKGMTYDEAVLAYGDQLDLSYIAGVYGRSTADKSTSLEQQLKDAAYSKYFDANGNVLPNYTITIDQKNGRPVVEENKTDSGAKWYNPFSWF